MSRCFPFPPPGYDKKIPLEYENLLKKEKKHKKDKRYKKDKKEKKEKDKKDKKRKHKKVKERSEDERKEKKDSTEALKDNGKHREKNLNNGLAESGKHSKKELKQASVENDTAGPLKYNSFKNLGSNCAQRDDASEFDASEFNFLLDSRKRTKDDSKVKDSPLIQKIDLPGRMNSEASGTVLKNLGSNCAQRDDTSEFKFLLDSRKTTRDDSKVKDIPPTQKIDLPGKRNYEASGTGLKDKRDSGQSEEFVARSQNDCSLPSHIGGDERRIARVPGLVDKRITEQKENGVHKNVDAKKVGHKVLNREKKSKSMGEIGEDKANVKLPDTEQFKTKENSRDALCFDNGKPSPVSITETKASNLGKRKALEINDVLLHEKESQPNKLRRFRPPFNHVSDGEGNLEPCMPPTQSISKFSEKVENHKVSSEFSYNGSKLEATQANMQPVSERQENCANYNLNNDILSSHSVFQNDAGELKKNYASKKLDSEMLQTSNGHNRDGEITLCHPVLSNGKAVEEAIINLSNGGDLIIDGQKVNHNDLKINGRKEDKEPNVSSSSKKVKKNGGTSAKPPHPDSKYLSEILNIPSVDWPDMDNQEWLFSGSGNQQSKKSTSGSSQAEQSKKSTSGSSQAAETKHVWSKALLIESADVIALPYVVPY